jgi:hypothetical protein
MDYIHNVYIHKIDKNIDAEYISYIFHKNNIADVSKIILETNDDDKSYNRAFIEIQKWYNTEIAYNFIMRLKDPCREARLVYYQDEWWIVEINEFPYAISKKYDNYKIVTVFNNIYINTDDIIDNDIIDNDNIDNEDIISTTPVSWYPSFDIDYEKTKQLKAILYGNKFDDEIEQAQELDKYLQESRQKIVEWNNDFNEDFCDIFEF